MALSVIVDRELAEALLPALAQAKQEDLGVTFESGHRPNEQQKELYDEYLRRKKLYDAWVKAGKTDPPVLRPFPAAYPGFSFHNYALALDFGAKTLAARERFGLICEEHGLRWGGCGVVTDNFDNDPIHVDLGRKYSIAQARALGFPRQLVWLTAEGEIRELAASPETNAPTA